ncbi:MAG: ABC transporter permease, partial [Vallitaleaceae bacterium]|nr:ABC transporter permease [Vallitaleaceae bacterium]
MNSWVIGRRLIKEIGNDQRTVAMLFIAPIFILTLFYVVLNTTIEHVNLGVLKDSAFTVESEDVTVIEYNDEESMKTAIMNKNIDGYLVTDERQIRLVVEGTEPSIDSKVIRELQSGMMKSIQQKLNKLPVKIESFEMTVKPFYGEELSNTFESIAPFMMGYV